jgi:hypothetical protein
LDGHLDYPLTVGEDDVFLRDDAGQVLFDSLLDALLVPLLILRPLAVQRPVVL